MEWDEMEWDEVGEWEKDLISGFVILFFIHMIHKHYRVDFCYMVYVYVVKLKCRFHLASKQSSFQLLPST